MSKEDEPYVASLFRNGEVQPYVFEVLPAKDWDEADRLANEWAVLTLGDGGIQTSTSLHLKHGAKGKFLRKWDGI
jgi:hypothetical protein